MAPNNPKPSAAKSSAINPFDSANEEVEDVVVTSTPVKMKKLTKKQEEARKKKEEEALNQSVQSKKREGEPDTSENVTKKRQVNPKEAANNESETKQQATKKKSKKGVVEDSDEEFDGIRGKSTQQARGAQSYNPMSGYGPQSIYGPAFEQSQAPVFNPLPAFNPSGTSHPFIPASSQFAPLLGSLPVPGSQTTGGLLHPQPPNIAIQDTGFMQELFEYNETPENISTKSTQQTVQTDEIGANPSIIAYADSIGAKYNAMRGSLS